MAKKLTQSDINRETGVQTLLIDLEIESKGEGTTDLLKIARLADPFGVFAEAQKRFASGERANDRDYYIVGLVTPPDGVIVNPIRARDGRGVLEAVRATCKSINWNPTKHYEDFWSSMAEPPPLDHETWTYMIVDTWGSGVMADIVVGKESAIRNDKQFQLEQF